MSKLRPDLSHRLTCSDARFVEIEFPRQLRPRLVIEFSEGFRLLLEDDAAVPLTANALKVFLALDPCDMRKSFNGLQQLAAERKAKAEAVARAEAEQVA